MGGAGGCIWLELEGERGEARWPPGFVLQADRASITDAKGATVARVGDALHGVILGPKSISPSRACAMPIAFEVYQID